MKEANLNPCFGQFSNDEKGLQNLQQWLGGKIGGCPDEIKVIIESTGSYHWLTCLMLKEAGYDVRLINPR